MNPEKFFGQSLLKGSVETGFQRTSTEWKEEKKILKEIKINNPKFWQVQNPNELQFFMSAFASQEE